MLKRYAPSKKKKKNSEINFTPTPNQEGCIDENMDFESDSEDMTDTENISQSLTDSEEEENIEDFIRHLEDIRSISDQDFDLLKENIREQDTL
jgi:hypothetical protein